MEDQLTLESRYAEKKYLLSQNQYILLSICTFNIYNLWWTYKAWKIFRARENYSILPALRTLFSIFFQINLFNRIQNFAQATGYEKQYDAIGLFIGILVFNAMGYLPDPYWLLSTLSFLFFLPAFNALNYAVAESDDYEVAFQEGFNGRQIFLIVAGSIFWVGALLGLMMGQ